MICAQSLYLVGRPTNRPSNKTVLNLWLFAALSSSQMARSNFIDSSRSSGCLKKNSSTKPTNELSLSAVEPHLSLAKIPSTLISLTFFQRRAKTSTHYEKTTKAVFDPTFPIQKDLQSRSGEPGAPPAVGHHETLEQAPSTSPKRPSLLGLALPFLERLARRSDRCQTRHRSALA